MDALCALHDCAMGISPVTSYSGVKDIIGMHCELLVAHGGIFSPGIADSVLV